MRNVKKTSIYDEKHKTWLVCLFVRYFLVKNSLEAKDYFQLLSRNEKQN